jgi:hypothetical protein
MLHNDAAQQRAGEQPASAPTASQKFPRAQTAAKLKIPTLKQANSRHGDIVATGLRDGSMGAMPIHIYGKHSPPFLPMTHDTATHAARQWSLHPEGPMASPPLAHMYQRQPARYHSLGDGHVQAHSVFGPELGTGQQQLYAWHGTPSKSAAKVIQPQPPALPPEAWPCEATQTRPNSQREIRSS